MNENTAWQLSRIPPFLLAGGDSVAQAEAGDIVRTRLQQAKRAYSVRRVAVHEADSLLGSLKPHPGDLVLARVLQLGLHQHLESADGRRQRLWPGDEVIVAYGACYAPDQFEAVIPDDLLDCHLVAGGGVAARMVTRHTGIQGATQIQPIGLLASPRGVLNLRDAALGAAARARAALTIAVVGSSMNSGKTTTAAHLIAGLRRAGLRVGAAKVTGTGAGGDRWLMLDAGAACTVDCTDMGHASTAGLAPSEVERIFANLCGHVASSGVDSMVVEVADGLLQRETAALLQSKVFAETVDAVLYAAPDALSAVAGVAWLRQRHLPLVAVSGLLTASPLATREAAAAVGVPTCTVEQIATPEVLHHLLPRVTQLARQAPRGSARHG